MKSNLLITFKLSNYITVLFFLLFTFCSFNIINAQATLSVQGIVKKSNGVALEDGEYPITFKLYAVTMPPSNVVLWDETIPNVEVISGIYSEILGENPSDPLNIPFNADYELGISIGSQEMLPRIRLTSAPYALSLRGETNQFPSTGLVLADDLRVAQGVLARAGVPGLSGVNKNGYGMIGNNDTGLFSTAYGKVSLFVSNVEKLEVTPNGAKVLGTMNCNLAETNQVNIFSNGGISYTSSQGNFKGWRLADVDDIESTGPQGIDADANGGWKEYNKLSGEFMGWNNSSGTTPACLCGFGTFNGNVIVPTNNEHVLKKKFKIAGDFSQIKVRFKYYVVDNWNANDYGFAGFATQENGSTFRVGWLESMPTLETANNRFSTNTFESATQFAGSNTVTDLSRDVEMTARRSGTAPTDEFWVFIGSATNGSYAVGPVEIWVR